MIGSQLKHYEVLYITVLIIISQTKLNNMPFSSKHSSSHLGNQFNINRLVDIIPHDIYAHSNMGKHILTNRFWIQYVTKMESYSSLYYFEVCVFHLAII